MRLPAGSTLGTIVWLHLHDPARPPTSSRTCRHSIADGDVEATGDTARQRPAMPCRLQRNGLLIAAAIVALAGLLAIAQAVARHLAPRREDAHVLAAIGLTHGAPTPRRPARRADPVSPSVR